LPVKNYKKEENDKWAVENDSTDCKTFRYWKFVPLYDWNAIKPDAEVVPA